MILKVIVVVINVVLIVMFVNFKNAMVWMDWALEIVCQYMNTYLKNRENKNSLSNF